MKTFLTHTHWILTSTVHAYLVIFNVYHWHLLARWQRAVIPIQEVKTKIHGALKHLTELRATWNRFQDTSADVGPGDLLDVTQQSCGKAENSACVFIHLSWSFSCISFCVVVLRNRLTDRLTLSWVNINTFFVVFNSLFSFLRYIWSHWLVSYLETSERIIFGQMNRELFWKLLKCKNYLIRACDSQWNYFH